MDTIKAMMQAMKAEKEKAEDQSDQFLQKLGEQRLSSSGLVFLNQLRFFF